MSNYYSYSLLIRGSEFRKDYSQLGMVCAAFPNVPVIAMTATANKKDRNGIKASLGLRNCMEVIGNYDRIFFL
jgi:ATP-dependent DNA helicase RecQ